MKSNIGKNLQTESKLEVSPKIIENLRKSGLNKQCFDCEDMTSSYAVLDFGTFVCHQCALFHKELNHSIKEFSTSKFYDSDQNILTNFGNEKAKKLWMEKFDSKKEKIPKAKDIPRFKKFLNDKYLHRKYASKDLIKELSNLKIEKFHAQQPFSDINSSSDDSSNAKDTVNKSEFISLPIQQEAKDKNKFEISEAIINQAQKDDDEINYPKISNYFNLNSIEASSPDVNPHVNGKNRQNNKNLFFFENFDTPCDNKVDLKDWGIIWEGENKKSEENANKHLENSEGKEESVFSIENKNFITEEKYMSTQPKEWEFPMDFDLVNLNTQTTTSSTNSPDNITSLSQNLNGIYNSYTSAQITSGNESRKSFDDLERYLCDPGFTTPANRKPAANPLSVNINQAPKQYSHMNIVGQTHNIPYNNSFTTMTPHMMMNYSYNINQINNNYQMSNMIGAESVPSNVKGNPSNCNSSNYVSKTPSGPAMENLSFNFNLLNVNQQNFINGSTDLTRTTPIKYDAFHDIYNYSKNTKSSSNRSSDNNIVSSLKNEEQNPNINNKPLTTKLNSNFNNKLNNPFDF